jgi:Iap family predicted aminopeptidase
LDKNVKYGESAYALMEKLDYIRAAGTEGETKAAGALRGELESMGLLPISESFEIENWDIQKASLETVGPRAKSYPVTGYGLSGSTGADGLRAPFLYAENGNDIVLSQAKGKIIMLNAAPDGEMYRKTAESGAAGFIAVSGLLTDEREKTDLEQRFLRRDKHLKNGELPQIPGVSIRAADAAEMLREEPEEVVLTLVQSENKAQSGNIIAEIPGTDKPGEWIVVGAHYDSVFFSRDMYDNASGSAVIMEACRYFTRHKPKRSLRFIWFGAEERGLLGSRHHILSNPEEIKAAKLMINVDLAGQVIGHHEFAVTAKKEVGDILKFIAQETGFGCTVKQNIYSSDSTAYADAGVPAFSFFRAGTIGHSRYDKIEFASPATMEKTAAFMIYFTEKIVNSAVFPIPPGIPEDQKEQLEIYFGRKPPKE